MTSKTVDGETTEFSYDSMVWQDQLTAVDGKELTYDSNGNLISYDGKEYTWSHGKRLESITDGENTYTYKYNSDGIRTSKTINGTTIEFDVLGSVILSCGNMYFQYNNGRPVGFVYKDVQYFYITNLSGDIVGITDDGGNQIAGYSYDEWGKLLSITTAEEGNEEQQKIAELNPLRYRGYYYDNETGYYYLQSRYYDPELGRFISADSFDYIDTDTSISLNSYVYCYNIPIGSFDYQGTNADLPLGYQDWTYRKDNNMGKFHGDKHMHVDSKQNGEHYAQDEDGHPHDKLKGSPSKKVKEKLKNKTGWDWDAKAKSYKENSEEFSLDLDFGLDLDFSNVGDLVIALLLVLICVPTGVLLGFLVFGLLIMPPVGAPG